MLAFDPDVAERDILPRERVRGARDDGVAFDGDDALDGDGFGVDWRPIDFADVSANITP